MVQKQLFQLPCHHLATQLANPGKTLAMASLNSGLANGLFCAVLATVCSQQATVPHSQGHCTAAMGANGPLGDNVSQAGETQAVENLTF